MKRHLLSVFVGLVTFLIGAIAVVIYYFPGLVEVVKNAPVVEHAIDCRQSTSFPGRSVRISDIKKYQNGYFPINAFNDGWQNSDSSMNAWYGKFLRALGEKSLLDNQGENYEVYRFLWLRSFHHPVAVRLERRGYKFELVAIELDGAGGYEPGRLFRTDHISVSQEQWCSFMELLDGASFWNQETKLRDDGGPDGAEWVLEGVKNDHYHIVDRWSPMSGKYREACVYLLGLSGRDPDKLKDLLY